MADRFIGAGWSFPARIDSSGGVGLATGRRELEESIRIILATTPGERPMRPDFGCGIHNHMFAEVDDTTAGLIAHEVRTALQRWEPRVRVDAVVVEPDPSEPGMLHLNIAYTPSHTNDARNLVFPFYTIPGGAPSAQSTGVAT